MSIFLLKLLSVNPMMKIKNIFFDTSDNCRKGPKKREISFLSSKCGCFAQSSRTVTKRLYTLPMDNAVVLSADALSK